jgi:nicotinamide riboside kinase
VACVKICITGPESSGKSTLAKVLSQQFSVPLVDEKARQYLLSLGRKHKLADLTEIASLQFKAEVEAKKKSKCIICDTDLLTIKIWAEDKYKASVGLVEENLKEQLADFYVVCYPDLTWQQDPLREDEHRRLEIFNKYVEVLNELNANYAIIKGIGAGRRERAIAQVDAFLNR